MLGEDRGYIIGVGSCDTGVEPQPETRLLLYCLHMQRLSHICPVELQASCPAPFTIAPFEPNQDLNNTCKVLSTAVCNALRGSVSDQLA